MALIDQWPLFGLRVRTPRLELCYPNDQQVAELAELAVQGIHQPGFQPFLRAWDEVPPPHQQRNTLQFVWGNRATWKPTSWHCSLVVLIDGQVVGSQGMLADRFALRRTVETGSWLGRAWQGQGFGQEMRAAVLHLAFVGLGAVRAESSAWHDNGASHGVSRKLGYVENGDSWLPRGDTPEQIIRLLLARERWEPYRRQDIQIEGLEPCLPYFGAVPGEWLLPG